jgi:hypothetical protein
LVRERLAGLGIVSARRERSPRQEGRHSARAPCDSTNPRDCQNRTIDSGNQIDCQSSSWISRCQLLRHKLCARKSWRHIAIFYQRKRFRPWKRYRGFGDASMAEAMLKAGARGPAILITGNGHVNKARGVPWYLDQAGADGVVVIALTETMPEARTVSNTPADDNVADYIWFTTNVDRGDPCAMLIDTPRPSK